MAAGKYLRKIIKQLLPDETKAKAPQADEKKVITSKTEGTSKKKRPKTKVVKRKLEKEAGRPRKPRGVKPATPAEKAGAKKAGIGVKAFRALPQAEQKKWIKKTSEKKYGEHIVSAAAKAGIGVKAFRELSKAKQQKLIEKVKKPGKSKPTAETRQKEETELDRLTAQQKEEMDADLRPKKTATGTRRRKLTPAGEKLFNEGKFDEIISNPKKYITDPTDAPLRPKGTRLSSADKKELKGGSPDDKAEYIRNVLLEDPGHVVGTPVQVSPQLRGKTSAKELKAMQKEIEGSQFKSEINPETGEDWTAGLKGGGRLKYYKKGGRIKKSSKKPKGVGKALRGYGKAMGRG